VRRRRWAALAFGLALLAGGARGAAGEDYDPFRIPREQFRAQVKRVALRPLVAPPGAPEVVRARASLEGLIAAALERQGFAVVPSREFGEAWRRFAGDLGGVYDPVSGEPDEAKYQAAWEYTTRELETRLDVDAILVSNVHYDFIQPALGFGDWKAAGKTLLWQGQPLGAAPIAQPQRVEGPFLGVRIFDRAAVLLYDVRMPLEWSRIYAGRGYEERPETELLNDATRNAEVVDTLLGYLAPPPDTTPAAQPSRKAK
jgi:hypothetical protein